MVQEGANSPMVMRFRVALPGIKPAPWRRIEVLASTTLAGLHEVIQAAMGWEDLHLHCFRILGRRYDGEYADLTRVLLADLRLRAGERSAYKERPVWHTAPPPPSPHWLPTVCDGFPALVA